MPVAQLDRASDSDFYYIDENDVISTVSAVSVLIKVFTKFARDSTKVFDFMWNIFVEARFNPFTI